VNIGTTRTRFGFAGSADYKLEQAQSPMFEPIFSILRLRRKYGNYNVNVGSFAGARRPRRTTPASMGMNHFHRTPQQQIYSFTAGANHSFGATLITYDFSFGRATYDGGFQSISGTGRPTCSSASDTSIPATPRFPVLNGVNIYDPAAYTLSAVLMWNDHIRERDYSGSLTMTRQYTVKSHFGAFEVGLRIRDADKVRTGGREFLPYTGSAPLVMSSALKAIQPTTILRIVQTWAALRLSKTQQFINANKSFSLTIPARIALGTIPITTIPVSAS